MSEIMRNELGKLLGDFILFRLYIMGRFRKRKTLRKRNTFRKSLRGAGRFKLPTLNLNSLNFNKTRQRRKQEKELENATNLLEADFKRHEVGDRRWDELITEIEREGGLSPALSALIHVALKAENVEKRQALRNILTQNESLKEQLLSIEDGDWREEGFSNYFDFVTQNLSQADERQRRGERAKEEWMRKKKEAARKKEEDDEDHYYDPWHDVANSTSGMGREAGFKDDAMSGAVKDIHTAWNVKGKPYGGKKSRRKRRKKSRAKRRRTRR